VTTAVDAIGAPPRFRLFDGPSSFHGLERFAAAPGGRAEVEPLDVVPAA